MPGGDGELRLLRRGDEFVIMLGRAELMNSRRGGSEEAFATLVAARLDGRKPGRWLIGGLGMGFTLRAALSTLGPGVQIDVAELVPAVVAWARGPLAPLFRGCLDDPRVAIHETDVAQLIRAGASRYDAILLDVDNGPDGLTRAGNDALYTREGLSHAYRAVKPGGILAVWSAEGSEPFVRRLRSAGFDVEEEKVRDRGNRGARHVVWIAARRPSHGPRPSKLPASAAGGAPTSRGRGARRSSPRSLSSARR